MEQAVVLHNGSVDGHPDADALVLEGDRIGAVGRLEELRPRVDDCAVWIDLHGQAVLPGFVDAHVHLVDLGLVESGWRVDLTDRSRAEAVDLLQSAVRARGAGEWVVASGWDESGWPKRRYLDRRELDGVSHENPILAVRIDGHLLTANSAALDRAPEAMPEGLVDRGQGHLREAAVAAMLAQVIPDRAVARDALAAATRLCHRLGVTSVHTMSRPVHLPALADDGYDRQLRVTVYPWIDSLPALESVREAGGLTSSSVRFGGVKLFADGSIGARNAAVSRSYRGGGAGRLNHGDAELARLVAAAEGEGWRTAVHAIGDLAIDQVLGAHETARTDPRVRHRIEHLELVRDEQLARAAELGLCVCMQPNFIGNWSGPGSLYVDRLGAKRDRMSNPLSRVVAAGLPLAFGSDGMPLSPLYGLHWAVNGPHPDQRISVRTAIDRYTAGGAWIGFEERRLGTIAPAMLADLVVLDEHPAVHPEAIRERTVTMTFVGGKRVYPLEEFA